MKKIKIENLEKNILRKSIPYGEEVIVINELSSDKRRDLISTLILSIQNQEELNIKTILLDMIDTCTNVEFDGDIFEVENPTYEVKAIYMEISIMFEEIMNEAYTALDLALEKSKGDLLKQKILIKGEEIKDTVKEIEKENTKSKKSNKKAK